MIAPGRRQKEITWMSVRSSIFNGMLSILDDAILMIIHNIHTHDKI